MSLPPRSQDSLPVGLEHMQRLSAEIDAAKRKIEAIERLLPGKVGESVVDAKGDLIVGTAADTVARKAAGANDDMLTSSSGQPDGLLWRPRAAKHAIHCRLNQNWLQAQGGVHTGGNGSGIAYWSVVTTTGTITHTMNTQNPYWVVPETGWWEVGFSAYWGTPSVPVAIASYIVANAWPNRIVLGHNTIHNAAAWFGTNTGPGLELRWLTSGTLVAPFTNWSIGTSGGSFQVIGDAGLDLTTFTGVFIGN